jgi:hypothetical protein
VLAALDAAQAERAAAGALPAAGVPR